MEDLKKIGEFGLIENIKGWIHSRENISQDEIVGIGDDAAVLNFFGNNLFSSIDTLVEDVHFTLKTTSFRDLGWKALAVNISDIAAMGGIPKYALISFACPPEIKVHDLQEFYFGFKELADFAGVKLVGGDTVRTGKKIVVSVSILGESFKNKYVLRSGAKDGDFVCATGTLGDSAAGLAILLEKTLSFSNQSKKEKYLINRFNRPTPRFVEGKIIGENNLANAMIDVSDGLVFSAFELAEKSNLGIILDETKIPISPELKKMRSDYLKLALYGGEDYELLFCVGKDRIEEAEKLLKNMTVIGVVDKKFEGVKLKKSDGEIEVLKKQGYEAFQE